MLRIIGGRFRGRKLKAPKGLATRPVLGRVREALFNVLGAMDGLRALDLFAGTGAVGIEALSRGASECVFVDSGRAPCRSIRDNLESLDVSADVLNMAVDEAIGFLARKARTFDFVFADPPYGENLGPATIGAVFAKGVLARGGVAALTARKTDPYLPGDVPAPVFDRVYGDTRLVMFKAKEADEAQKQVL